MSAKVSEDVVDQFTCGDCWLLAWELHARFGFELVLVFVEDGCQPWNHVVAKVGDDAHLDIEGVHTSAELTKRWDEFWGWDSRFELKPVGGKASRSFASYHRELWGEKPPCSVEEMLSCDKESLGGIGIKVLSAVEAADVVVNAYATELAELGVAEQGAAA